MAIFFLISAKVDTSAAAAAAAAAEQQAEQQAEASRQSSIHNLVTKVMGEQSIHNIEVSKQAPATLTITPVRTGNNQNTGNGCNTGNGSGQGRIIQMIDHGRTSAAVAAATSNVTRLRSRDLGSRDQQIRDQQPDTTESLD